MTTSLETIASDLAEVALTEAGISTLVDAQVKYGLPIARMLEAAYRKGAQRGYAAAEARARA